MDYSIDTNVRQPNMRDPALLQDVTDIRRAVKGLDPYLGNREVIPGFITVSAWIIGIADRLCFDQEPCAF